ncbi:MAG TPA: ATP-dependent DNA helicase [Solirubrobacterales bacterium]|nr:ATP-dependent DNA helicase [Solirubrobacterales bacterium]
MTEAQRSAVTSEARRLLVVAGAGSGKTEVMARRIAHQVAVKEVERARIAAFTFTERAAEEMQFRVRRQLAAVTGDNGDPSLSGMYLGTIHAYCLKLLRELAPDDFHNFDVLDDGARVALVERRFWNVLSGRPLQDAFEAEGLSSGHFACVERFLHAYDLLNEYHQLRVELPPGTAPGPGREEEEWCAGARLLTDVGNGPAAEAFAVSAARYYALLRCRRFLDFSSVQAELLNLLERSTEITAAVREQLDHLVVDEVQDINPVQDALIRHLVGEEGAFTAVGDHRQAIFGWRGGRVDIMGALHDELAVADEGDGEIVELEENFRSTPRLIDLANRWSRTISPPGEMAIPDMSPGRELRQDFHPSHVGLSSFEEREEEADWIAETISKLIVGEEGARHDLSGGDRGIQLADIAILLRSATDARAYGDALRARGIEAVFRGSDLFAQPEVLLFLAALARVSGIEQFYGRALTGFIDATLGCDPEPEPVLRAAADELEARGIPVGADLADRLLRLTDALHSRVYDEDYEPGDLSGITSAAGRTMLRAGPTPRRVFPQAIFHVLLEEAGVATWDVEGHGGESAMFHLGAFSRLITSIEMPGWTTPGALKYQIIGLCMWGPSGTRLPEAELLAAPDAVSIGTVHSAKGLEWPVVFLADVKPRRFPSQLAKRRPRLPFEGDLAAVIDPAHLADNDNYDAERRLMYVALTRAERYLFVSASGRQQSAFRRELEPLILEVGGRVVEDGAGLPEEIELRPGMIDAGGQRLVSSFSDLRYYLECPHDFYLRKVLGFSPTIDQAFGYGRGVHNLMRAVHADPAKWAKLAEDPVRLQAELKRLVDQGLFYLRYTTGEPLRRMQEKAVEVVGEYVGTYGDELSELEYEPEREFETLLPEEDVLISGAIDVIRRDDPPRVTLIDFKSGEASSDLAMKLDAEEMRLQVSLYGIAARAEMEYEPERGLVRYLGEKNPDERELDVPLDEGALAEAAETIASAARAIKGREFHSGPVARSRDEAHGPRCGRCDFASFCGLRSRA